MNRILPAATLLACGASLAVLAGEAAPPQPKPAPGYWDLAASEAILHTTLAVHLAPTVAGVLRPGETQALARLIEVGQIFQGLYETQQHHQAETAYRSLMALDRTRQQAPPTQALLTLYRLFQGPIATTLDNHREAFLPVDPPQPGKNVYPWGVTRDEIEAFLQQHPEARESLLDARTAVRRAEPERLRADIAALARHPVLDALHPGLRRRLEQMPRGKGFYAVPYSVAWADELVHAYALLGQAADAVQTEDAELARYLRNRGRDLLSDDYESGDASWVTGRFVHLNAQIGAYETYDDGLYGVKAFFACSLLLRDAASSEALGRAISSLQQVEDALPSPQHRRVRSDIPVGVYDVIADFGQARGVNTATILPNDSLLVRRYGRTILLRANIMKDPGIVDSQQQAFRAALLPEHHADLRPDGDFYRTLWHEIGHYLGVDADRSGRDLDTALQEDADAFEEMKADLVSLFAAPRLKEQGYYDAAGLRSVYAAGILRVLQGVRPRREQPYQTMQLVQMNWFLEQGLLEYVPAEEALRIHEERYAPAVASLLERVLALQYAGDKTAADAFLDRYTRWQPDLHERLASRIRASVRHRFRLVHYAALGE
jgi:Zincin-like metallopeptidase